MNMSKVVHVTLLLLILIPAVITMMRAASNVGQGLDVELVARVYGGVSVSDVYRFGNAIIVVVYPNTPLYSYRNAHVVLYGLEFVYSSSVKDVYEILKPPNISTAEALKRTMLAISKLRSVGIVVKWFDANTTAVINIPHTPLRNYTTKKVVGIYVDIAKWVNDSYAYVPNPRIIEMIARAVGEAFKDVHGTIVVYDAKLWELMMRNYDVHKVLSKWYESLGERLPETKPEVYKFDSNKLIEFYKGPGVIIAPSVAWHYIGLINICNATWDELTTDAKKWIMERVRNYVDLIRANTNISDDTPLYVCVWYLTTLPKLVIAEPQQAMSMDTKSSATDTQLPVLLGALTVVGIVTLFIAFIRR
jgi:hypothetical protein